MVWKTGVRFPAEVGIVFVTAIQTGSGAHPASYSIVSGALSLEIKQPGHENTYSPPSRD
jgi:hypothetical protein